MSLSVITRWCKWLLVRLFNFLLPSYISKSISVLGLSPSNVVGLLAGTWFLIPSFFVEAPSSFDCCLGLNCEEFPSSCIVTGSGILNKFSKFSTPMRQIACVSMTFSTSSSWSTASLRSFWIQSLHRSKCSFHEYFWRINNFSFSKEKTMENLSPNVFDCYRLKGYSISYSECFQKYQEDKSSPQERQRNQFSFSS